MGHTVGHLGCMPSIIVDFFKAGTVDGLDVSCAATDVSIPPFWIPTEAQPGSNSGSGISKVERIGTSGMKTTTITATIAAAIPTQKLDEIAIDTES